MHGAAPSARRASLNLKAEDGALAADTGGALDRASRATGKRRQPVTTSRRRHSALVLAAQQESRSSFASASDPVFGRGLFKALSFTTKTVLIPDARSSSTSKFTSRVSLYRFVVSQSRRWLIFAPFFSSRPGCQADKLSRPRRRGRQTVQTGRGGANAGLGTQSHDHRDGQDGQNTKTPEYAVGAGRRRRGGLNDGGGDGGVSMNAHQPGAWSGPAAQPAAGGPGRTRGEWQSSMTASARHLVA